LLLHGWGGNLNSFRTFEKGLIKSGFSVLTLDFPCFGGSEMPPETFSLIDYYKIVSELLMAENLSSVSVVGHSFGGRVAIMLASFEPEKVKKLVLVDSAGIKPKFSLSKKLKVLRYKFLKSLKNKGIIKRDLTVYGSSDYKALPESVKPVFSRIVNTDLTNMLKNISAPTLIVWGKKDTETPLYMAKKLNKKIKDSAIIAFEDCGHFCYLQKPYDFQVIVENFLK
jgi:pimeloyl-ACP methyl ester carboxylesterase